MKVVIQCENVWKIFNSNTPAEVQALRGIDLSIKEGEFVSIMGASGSGKSTLLNCVGLLDKPTKGKIFIEGKDISKLNDNELALIRRNKIGFVFQFFNLIPNLTALQNVELPMVFKGVHEAERKKRARELLESIGLGTRLDSKPTKMSGGEVQRVAIARALANEPIIIFADEPTGNLDSKTGKSIIEIFKKLNEDSNSTIAVITHDMSIAEKAKRIIKIHDGMIVK